MDSHRHTRQASHHRQPAASRSRVIGSIVAILAMIGLGALAWHLTHQAAGAPGAGRAGAAAGGRRRRRRPGGGRRRRAAAGHHGRRGDGRAGRHPGHARSARHRHRRPRPSPCGRRCRACCRRSSSPKARWSRPARCWPRSIRARSRWRCCRPPASASATRRSSKARALTLERYRTLLDAGLDRAPGRRHPGRAGQAARRHGDDRPRGRRHGPAQPRLHPGGGADQRAASACAWSTSATWSAAATPTASP